MKEQLDVDPTLSIFEKILHLRRARSGRPAPSRPGSCRSSPTRCGSVPSKPAASSCGKVKHRSPPISWCAAAFGCRGGDRSWAKSDRVPPWESAGSSHGTRWDSARSPRPTCSPWSSIGKPSSTSSKTSFRFCSKRSQESVAPSSRLRPENETGARARSRRHTPSRSYWTAWISSSGFFFSRCRAGPSSAAASTHSPRSRNGHSTGPLNPARRSGAKATARATRVSSSTGTIACRSSRDDGPVQFRVGRGIAIGALESIAGQPRWHDAVAETHAEVLELRRGRPHRRLRGQRRDGHGFSRVGLQ